MIASAVEKSERETVIRIGEGKAAVFTADLPMFRKLNRLGYTLVEDCSHHAWFEGPVKGISFRRAGIAQKTGTRRRPPMTAEHKAKLREGRRKVAGPLQTIDSSPKTA